MSRDAALVGAVVLTAVATVSKLAFAAHWALLADEAYYWVWAQHLDWGYYDQPPLIAWLIAASTALLGRSELAVRLPTVLCGALGFAALLPIAKDKALWALWWLGVPSLCWLCWLSTPDANLLAAWAVALAGAMRGGRWWVLAGVGAGLAFLSKYTGAAVFPLCVLAVGPRARRSPWPWVGGLVAAAIVAPNLWWNARHEWIAFAFQFDEGLVSDAPPGAAGALHQVLDQALVLTPLLYIALWWWAISRAGAVWRSWRAGDAGGRVERIAWLSAVPLTVFFALAATREVAEAHWPAIAYVGLGVGLAAARGPLHRLAWVGLGTGLVANIAITVHTLVPLVPLEHDPAVRLTEGPIVAAGVASWAFPEGALHGPEEADRARTVYTERYQEASFVHFYTGIPARRYPGCGRDDQYDLWPLAAERDPIFVRQGLSRSASICTDDRFDREGPFPFRVVDAQGRRDRNRQVFVLTERAP